jgi:transcriptional regulator GlxA family with amidase domain
MSANKTSAVAADEPVDVLFALQDKFDLLDFAGPVEAFTNALHNFKDQCKNPSLVARAGSYPSVTSMHSPC